MQRDLRQQLVNVAILNLRHARLVVRVSNVEMGVRHDENGPLALRLEGERRS